MLSLSCALFLALAPLPEGQTTFRRLSLDAEALCAAGVTVLQVEEVVGDLNASPAAINAELAAADATYSQAQQYANGLQTLVRSGQAAPQQVSDLADAKAALETAAQARDGVLDTLFDAGLSSLSQPVQNRLATIRANRRWKLPMEFLVTNRTQADWVALRDNLSQERITTELEEPLEAVVAQALATARANSEVAAAKTRLDSDYSAIQLAWDAAFIE